MSLEPRDFTFDLIVIGGGIAGAGIARDACLRGLSCLLIEKGDFASGTSSKTSRLIHGGISHLERGEFHLVLESMQERDLLSRLAPHFLRPLPIVMPLYRNDPQKLWKIRLALGLYDWVYLGRGSDHYDILRPAATLEMFPSLPTNNLRGAAIFQDQQLAFPERLVLENILSAREHGGFCLNYHEAVDIQEGPQHFQVEVRDLLNGSFHTATGRVIVNATGIWADQVSSRYRTGLAPKTSPTKGTQVMVRGRLDRAICAPGQRERKLFFALPVEGQVLLGLARAPHEGGLDDVSPTQAEVQFLVDEFRRLLPDHALGDGDLLWAYSGLHPLALRPASRKNPTPTHWHVLHREGTGGRFLTIVGGTFSTFRRMAEETVDAACALLSHPIPSSTDRVPFFGGGFADSIVYRENLCEWTKGIPELPRHVLEHLIALYGRRCCDVLQVAIQRDAWREPVAPGYRDLKAQVIYAIREEDAHHLSDVILRRLRMGVSADRGLGGAPAVADLMAQELAWDEATRERELAELRTLLARERPFAAVAPTSPSPLPTRDCAPSPQ